MLLRAGFAGCAAGLLAVASPASPCPDLALVLAVDTSGSIDAAEHSIQTEGLAAAFSDPEVLAALDAAGEVAVAVIMWADARLPLDTILWHRIAGAGDAARLAAAISGRPRRVTGQTDIARALDAALGMIEALGPCTGRRIVNLSGDGPQTPHSQYLLDRPLRDVRSRAAEAGVTVNALAVGGEPGLAAYYASELVTGPGAFVMTIEDVADFAEAIRRKLLREIRAPLLASAE